MKDGRHLGAARSLRYMSAIGPKRTCACARRMSAQTCRLQCERSAYDPRRTFLTSAAWSGGSIEKRCACDGSTIPMNLVHLFCFRQNDHWSCSAHICVSLRSHLRLAALTFVMTMSPGVATSIIAFQETRARLRGRELYENASHRCSVCNLEWLQLPSPAAGDSESVHLKRLLLQNGSWFAD